MPVTVRDVLELEIMKSARVVAGMNGLSRVISFVNFFDSPVQTEIENLPSDPGEFYLGSFYTMKGSLEDFIRTIKYGIEHDCSGFCAVTQYIDDFPPKVKEIAEENNLPLILMDHVTPPYAEIIRNITELILLDTNKQLKKTNENLTKMRIDRLVDQKIEKEEVISLSFQLELQLTKKFFCLFLKVPEWEKSDMSEDPVKKIQNLFQKQKAFLVFKYGQGLLMVINILNDISMFEIVDFIKNTIEPEVSHFHMGLSRVYKKKEQVHLCVKEAIIAANIGEEIDFWLIMYEDTAIYNLLLALDKSSDLRNIHTRVIKPLLDKDSMDLINTIDLFLRLDGNFKKTAHYMNQHENTIRYRIEKAKKILKLEHNSVAFIEQISMGLKVHRLFQSQSPE